MIYIAGDDKNIREKWEPDWILLDIALPDGSGADDDGTKLLAAAKLIFRVKAVICRINCMEKEKYMRLHEIFMDSEKRRVYVFNEPVELTHKEFELLKLLMQNAGAVTARADIMEHVWGVSSEGKSRTLYMHIKTLRRKLGSAGKYIETVRRAGYRME